MIAVIGFVFIAEARTETPNSFLDIKLGTSLTDFLSKNPNARELSRVAGELVDSNISTRGMDVYVINRTTSSGDNVRIACYFYNNTLAIIAVTYSGWQRRDDFMDALQNRFGRHTSSRVVSGRDPFANANRTTEIVYWTTNSYVLNFLHTREIGSVRLIFADRAVQRRIEADRQRNNSRRIE